MGRRRAPTLTSLVRNNGNLQSNPGRAPSKRQHFLPPFAPPPCFISALALGLIIGSGAAAGDPGGCTPTGSNLTCTGTVTNPSAFTPSSDFTVDIGTTTPTVSPAYITQGSGFAGIKINAGNFGGTVSMTTGSTISVASGSGTVSGARTAGISLLRVTGRCTQRSHTARRSFQAHRMYICSVTRVIGSSRRYMLRQARSSSQALPTNGALW